MRKMLLAATALCLITGGDLLAQTASITDEGVGNIFSIQQASSGGATATIFGDHTGNAWPGGVIGSISQNGAVNSNASIYTKGGNGTSGSATATIAQTATGSNASITQYGNAGYPAAAASVSQGGSGHYASIEQGEDANAVGGFTSSITQTGTGNSALSYQHRGTLISSTIDQSGSGHTVSVSQDGGTGYLSTLASTVLQSGTGNDAVVSQTGGNLIATVVQSGTNGLATITQQ